MPVVSETTLAALMPVSVPVSFGTIVPSFERLIGYVDASTAPSGVRIQWKLYAISGGVRSLAAVSDPIPSTSKPYLIFAEPNEGVGVGVGMIAATTYEIVGTVLDGPLPVANVRAGFVGYDIEVNNPPNEVSASSLPLVFGTEVVFGNLAAHHARMQIQFDSQGVPNTGSQARVYGTITGGAGPITALIAEGEISNQTSDPPIPIDVTGLGYVTAQLRIISQNNQVGAGAVRGVIVGADINLDITGGGGSPTGPAGGYLARNYPNPIVRASPTMVFRPGGVDVSNVYSTWLGLMTDFALTTGPVEIVIDDSLAPANIPSAGMPVGGWDMQFRVTMSNGNPNPPAPSFTCPGATLNIPDGAQLKNLAGWRQIAINCTPGASGLSSLVYTQSGVVYMLGQASLVSGGTIPSVFVNIPPGSGFLFWNCMQVAALWTGLVGAELFSLSASSIMALIFTGASTFVNAKSNVLASAVGSTFIFDRDSTSDTFLKTAACHGALVFNNLLENGGESRNSVSVPANVTYVVDASTLTGAQIFFDEVLRCSPGGAGPLVIDLPDATLGHNKNRILRVIDVNGGSGAFPISLVPFGAQNLNGANAPVALSQNWNQWLVFCDGTQWVVNVDLDAFVGGAIGLDFVYKPGGVALNNVYVTEATLWTAMNNTLATTGGPITLAIDSSASGTGHADFALPHDCQGRIHFVSVNSLSFPRNVLRLLDGATLTNPLSVDLDLRIEAACATLPAMIFTGFRYMRVAGKSTLALLAGAAVPFISLVGAGQNLFPFTIDQGSGLDNSAAPAIPFITVGAGSTLSLEAFNNPFFGNHTNLVDPASAGNVFVTHDGTWPLPYQILPAGATETLVDRVSINSYANGIVFRPGGVQQENVFTTWAAVMAAFALTQGDVNIEIDTTFGAAVVPSAGMPAGGWDLQGRGYLVGAGETFSSVPLSIPDGATLKNAPGGKNLNVTLNPLLAGSNLPSFSYTAGMASTWGPLVIFNQTGTRPAVDIAAAVVLQWFMVTFSSFNMGGVGAEFFNTLAATSFAVLTTTGGCDINPATNVVAGPGHYFLTRDRTCQTHIMTAAFTGPAPTFAVREGLDSRNQVIVGNGVYTVDAAGIAGTGPFDENILCQSVVGGFTTVQLPDATLPMNKGRVLTIVDDNGSSQTRAIHVLPFGAQNLNGANAAQLLATNWSNWTVVCDGVQWSVNSDSDTAIPQQTVTANYTIDTTQFDGTVFTNPAVGSIDITFPAASAIPGRVLTVKDITNGAGPLYYRIIPNGADKIEGVNAPFPQNTPLGSNTFQSDGVSNWWAI